GADHEQSEREWRRGRTQAARRQREREAAAVRDRTNSGHQGSAQSRSVAAAVSPAARDDEPGGGTGEAVLEGNIRRSEEGHGHSAADRTGGAPRGARQDVPL